MTNIRILVQEGMKKALKAAQKPSLSKRDVKTILKAVASQARRIKGIDKQLPFGPNRTAEYKKKTPEQRKEMQKSYDSLRANIARLGAPFPEGSPTALLRGDIFGRPNVNPFERGQRIQRGYPPEASGREKLSTTERGAGFISVDGSKLPTMPGAPSQLNKALKGLPDKVSRTVYDPEKGPLQPDKKLTTRMRGLEGLKKKFSQTTAYYPTRKMASELEAHKTIGDLKGVQNFIKRSDQKKKLREKLPNALVPPMVQQESVDNPKDGADVQMKGLRDRLPGRSEATRQAIAKNPNVNPEVIARVVNRLAQSRADLTQANIRDGLKSDVDPLLADMQRQNKKTADNLFKRTGKRFIPSKPETGVINFRAEAVEMKAIRARRKLDTQIARDPNVGMHGPSHPMFHKSNLAKRVRGLEKRHKARRERIAQRDAENSSPVTDPMRARLIRAINKGNEQ